MSLRMNVVAAVTCVGLVISLGGVSASAEDATAAGQSQSLKPGSRHKLFRHSGGLAKPMPRMASEVSVGAPVRGRVPVTFRVAYAVSNTTPGTSVRPDLAVVTTRVARSTFPTGPRPNRSVFKKTRTDTSLDKRSTTKKYRLMLSRHSVKYLKKKGLMSKCRSKRTKALRLINISVQQYRDFQHVDGSFDWIEGLTFDASQHPVRTSDNPGGAITIGNSTNLGIFTFDPPGEIMDGFNGGGLTPNESSMGQVSNSSTGVDIALTGQAISCLYQGTDSSNPEGFNVTLAPGGAVSQAIVADDSKYDQPNSASQAAASASAAEYALQASLKAIGVAFSQAFGGPFTMPVDVAMRFLDIGGACDNQPNIVQIGAVTEDGLGSSNINWAIWDDCNGTCGGLANYYSEPWSTATESGTVVTDAVQLAPDSGQTYQGQPLWLTQMPVQGCGVGDQHDATTTGCTSQNFIRLFWTTQPPCPWTTGLNVNGGLQGGNEWCWLDAPTSPEVDYCGTDNAGCPSYPG